MKKKARFMSLLVTMLILISALSFPLIQADTTYVIQNPGNLSGYGEHVNEQYRIFVTGYIGSTIWGTGIYTADSALATAAVHAGYLDDGQSGILTVTILDQQTSYAGSTQNGVTSRDYGTWGLSYRIDSCVLSATAIPPSGTVIADPGYLKYNDYPDYTVLQISLVGSLDGSVWGTRVYTDDSDLSTAAVHAGILDVGESAIVPVTILPAQDSYSGTFSNGVTSANYGSWGGSYSFGTASAPATPTPTPTPIPTPTSTPAPTSGTVNDPGNLVEYRGQNNTQLQIRLVGSLSGTVWGTDVYTDDSALAVAAVHAGLLKVGQSGTVKVTILPQENSYTGSARNGVTSLNYGYWHGSYRFDSVSNLSAVPAVYTPDENIIETFESGVRLAWSEASGLGYRIFRSTSPNELGISVTDFFLTSTSYADVNVEPDTTYYYTVKPVLAEADPYSGTEELLGDAIATYSIRTSSFTYEPGSFKNFMILKLDNPYLTINGISQEIDPGKGTAPMILSGRTVVPIRAIVEGMGGTIQWEDRKSVV